MKNSGLITFLFGLSILLVIVAFFLYDFHSTTRQEVMALRAQLNEVDNKIAEFQRQMKVVTPAEKGNILAAVSKLQMEKVLMQLPFIFQLEMVENGWISFVSKLMASAEKRKAALRDAVIRRTASIDVSQCPPEFIAIFQNYASESGLNADNLEALRQFAKDYNSSEE